MVRDEESEVRLSDPLELETSDSPSSELPHKSSYDGNSLIEEPLDLTPHRGQLLGEDLASSSKGDMGSQTEHISKDVTTQLGNSYNSTPRLGRDNYEDGVNNGDDDTQRSDSLDSEVYLTPDTEKEEDAQVSSSIRRFSRDLPTPEKSDSGSNLEPIERQDTRSLYKFLVEDAEERGARDCSIGITMEDVSVEVVDTSSLEGSTFGNILCLPYTIHKAIRAKKNRRMKRILSDINILANPGEMVLILGRPGAGCSSLLRTATGNTSTFSGGVTGEILYSGIPQAEMLKHYKSSIIYNGETDVHFPYLTVQQTIDFAISCKTPAHRMNNISKREYVESMRDIYATMFGLKHTYHTKVGNDFVRGISGGERRRVSIVEALAAQGSVYSWDNPTRGLDASTALDYTRAMRTMSNTLGMTSLITVYQASESIYEIFDKVTVLYEGRQIYFGHISEAKGYFNEMGYICPPRQTTAEFLTTLTDVNGYHIIKPGYEQRVPRTAVEFEAYWKGSPEYKRLKEDIKRSVDSTDAQQTRDALNSMFIRDKSKYARKSSYYTASYLEQLQMCTKRGFQRIAGNKAYTIITVIANVVEALLIGSLFYNIPPTTAGAFSRGGILYFALLFYSLLALSNISFEDRQVVQKQKLYTLYHPSTEALAQTLSSFPFRMIGMTLLIVIAFFLANLRRQPGVFFIDYLFLAMYSEAINCLFQMIASFCKTLPQTFAIGGLIMMSLGLYSTYMIQLSSMHPWFKWIAYILPIRYAFESLLAAEFHGRHMDCNDTLIPQGPPYADVPIEYRVCAFAGSKPGQDWVLGDAYIESKFEYRYKDVWRNFGILWCFILGYTVIRALITEYKPPPSSTGEFLVFKKGSRKIKVKNDEESAPNEETTCMEVVAPEADLHEKSTDKALFGNLESKGVFIWKDVCYTIPYEGGERQLLDNVSGYCAPGTLTALMGESGAGKTTLLNTLAQRNVGIITGDMLVNGRPIDASFERRTGYVQQQDVHLAELTVKESLLFSARMRQAQSIPDSEKVAYVERIMDILNMDGYADALVGTPGSGLNVEQRKKLSIGVELVAKPDLLLFLDEPTSGLDSQSAWAIVELLKRLTEVGQSILCTIHQPSATLFEQFDRLLLLQKGGQTVYFGDIGENSETLLSYFRRNGARQCLPSENPAEYILEAIGAGATSEVTENWHSIWKSSPEFTQTNKEIDRLIAELSSDEVKYESRLGDSRFATSYFYQFRHVLVRTAITLWRNLNYIMSKMMLLLSSGLYVGFTFFNVGPSFIGLQNSMFAVLMSLIVSAPLMVQMQSKAAPGKEVYLVRESKSNMFHWSLLLITEYLNELPYQLVFSTIFYVSFYFPMKVHYQASYSGDYFLDYCIVFQLYIVGLGLLLLYVAPNLKSANVLLSLTMSFLLPFAGVFQPKSLMPGFWTFMWKASPYTYFVQNFLGTMLHDKPVICTEKELDRFDPPPGQTCGEYMAPFFHYGSGYLVNPSATSNCGYCIYSVGDEFLTHISAKYSYRWRNFGIFWVYICFNICGMLGLYYFFHIRKINLFRLLGISKLIGRIRQRKSLSS